MVKRRPKRLYKTRSGRYYIISKGKRKYIKAPPSLSQKQLVKINIQNIIGGLEKPKKKRKPKKKPVSRIITNQKILPEMRPTSGWKGNLPTYFFEPNKLGVLKDTKERGDKLIETLRALLQKNQTPVKAEPKTVLPEVGREPKLEPKPPSSPRPEFTRPVVPDTPGKTTAESIGLKKPQKRTLQFIINSFVTDTGSDNYIDFLEYQQNYPFKKISGASLLRDYNVTETAFNRALDEYFAEMEGKGKKIDMDGLYDTQIKKLNRTLFNVEVPVIAADETNDLLRYVKPGKDFGFIINTNPSSSDGSGNDGHRVGHWTSVFIDADNCSLEYNDPLVETKSVPKHILDIGKKIINKIGDKESYFKIKMNYLKNQNDYTNTCGLHAIQFLKDRYDGVPFSKATGYDRYFKENNVDNSSVGEDIIHKKFKNYL